MTVQRMRQMLAIAILLSASLFGQDTTPRRLEFEVASIHSNDSGSGNSRSSTHDGVYQTENLPLRQIVVRAFDAKDYQVVGPAWMSTDRYDIRAKVPEGSIDGQIPSMIQTLLVDRFKMKFHRETREMPIYALILAKGGPKFQLAADETNADSSSSTRGSPGSPNATGAGAAIGSGSSSGPRLSTMSSTGTLTAFAASISRNVDRPVIDMTGLDGRYEMRLQYSPQSGSSDADPQGPSIFTALTEQLGLRLEARKGPIEVIVVDSVERVREP